MPDEGLLRRQYECIQALRGFLDYEGLRLFACLAEALPAKGGPALEIGVFCGRSLAAIACAFATAEIDGVDPFFPDFADSPALADEAEYLTRAAGRLTPAQRIDKIHRVLGELEAATGQPFARRVRLHQTTQEEFMSEYAAGPRYQLCHLDGEHTYAAIARFLDQAGSVVAAGGLIVFDDMLNPGFPEISEAVHTHATHKRALFPVAFGFNKGFYQFGPSSGDSAARVAKRLRGFYSGPAYTVRDLHDGSIEIGLRAAAGLPEGGLWHRLTRRLGGRR